MVEPEVIIEERHLDTLSVVAPRMDKAKKEKDYKLPTYQTSHKRSFDLLHTKLELSFDWEKELVFGEAYLSLKPYFYPENELILDAKGMEFHVLALQDQNSELKYSYDGEKLNIDLGRIYRSDEEFELYIKYTADPGKTGGDSGSAAITSDQGLFFVNADGSDPDKPQQIWTQGETEFNSRWFPTIDKPNERCTQELLLTVDQRFQTLSNGVLLHQNTNPDGTRTDHYKLDSPHAPYLFMIAVGEFAVIREEWQGIPVEYYVEPEYEKYAKLIYPHTKEMLSFFSEKLNYPYPWPKYSQIVVRDYVSGAMENTSAVIFGDFIQLTDRELVDNTINEMIVAHELFHHWFGDLVTCESWANLTMNEAFADYSEYLWFEHKHGNYFADFHRYESLQGYLSEADQGKAHPLIHFAYRDKEDMFDSHSYNKGGLILHMLRNYVGDEAFWAGLNKYLNDNKYTAVEAHDLRLAFEAIVGEDLNWFFNQWFFSTGHPQLEVDYDYVEEDKELVLRVDQVQDPEKGWPPIFILPTTLDIYTNGKKERKLIKIDQRSQQFRFPLSTQPDLIVFDGDNDLLADYNFPKNEQQYLLQYELANDFFHKNLALKELLALESNDLQSLWRKVIKDEWWSFRELAVQNIDLKDSKSEELIISLATNDTHSKVRAAAIDRLAQTQDSSYISLFQKVIDTEFSYAVVASALKSLAAINAESAVTKAATFEDNSNPEILSAIGVVYGMKPSTSNLDFYFNRAEDVKGPPAMDYFQGYGQNTLLAEGEQLSKHLDRMFGIATNLDSSPWRRLASTKTLRGLQDYFDPSSPGTADSIRQMIQKIKNNETNSQLKMIYSNF